MIDRKCPLLGWVGADWEGKESVFRVPDREQSAWKTEMVVLYVGLTKSRIPPWPLMIAHAC